MSPKTLDTTIQNLAGIFMLQHRRTGTSLKIGTVYCQKGETLYNGNMYMGTVERIFPLKTYPKGDGVILFVMNDGAAYYAVRTMEFIKSWMMGSETRRHLSVYLWRLAQLYDRDAHV